MTHRDDVGRPAALIALIECETCGQIQKASHDFSYPADTFEELRVVIRVSCEKCGGQAKLHLKRELKPAR